MLKSAMNEFSSNIIKNNKISHFVISGGVAANKSIRNNLYNIKQRDWALKIFFPPTELCSDNAAMIAWAGIERFRLGFRDELNFEARPRWPLDMNAPFLKGAGVKH